MNTVTKLVLFVALQLLAALPNKFKLTEMNKLKKEYLKYMQQAQNRLKERKLAVIGYNQVPSLRQKGQIAPPQDRYLKPVKPRALISLEEFEKPLVQKKAKPVKVKKAKPIKAKKTRTLKNDKKLKQPKKSKIAKKQKHDKHHRKLTQAP